MQASAAVRSSSVLHEIAAIAPGLAQGCCQCCARVRIGDMPCPQRGSRGMAPGEMD
jgi:hypothetical protein